MVPQLQYAYDDGQENWVREPPVFFFTRGRLGTKLSDAVNEGFERIDMESELLFDGGSREITIRIHVGSRGHQVTSNNSSLVFSSRDILPVSMLRRYCRSNLGQQRYGQPRCVEKVGS